MERHKRLHINWQALVGAVLFTLTLIFTLSLGG